MRTEVPRRRNPNLALHPGINFSCLQVDGDLGGLIFAAGSVIALVAGVPAFRPFFFGALGGGLLLAAALVLWHERHPDPPRRQRPIELNLDGRDPKDRLGREQSRPHPGRARFGRPATIGA
jgi:hypothetical protein